MSHGFNRWIPFCGANTKEKLEELLAKNECFIGKVSLVVPQQGNLGTIGGVMTLLNLTGGGLVLYANVVQLATGGRIVMSVDMLEHAISVSFVLS